MDTDTRVGAGKGGGEGERDLWGNKDIYVIPLSIKF